MTSAWVEVEAHDSRQTIAAEREAMPNLRVDASNLKRDKEGLAGRKGFGGTRRRKPGRFREWDGTAIQRGVATRDIKKLLAKHDRGWSARSADEKG